jgi:hypothetical protein
VAIKGIFVFVVCGSREHIDTLHFSLVALKRFSDNRIIIVTDAARNEIPIIHDDVIQIQTPQEYNHHQASIYLKTGLYRFLPKGFRYCYLDTDVVALSSETDRIFETYHAPITFSTDHCRVSFFSPSAVNCGCLENYDSDNEKIAQFFVDVDRENQQDRIYVKTSIDEINEKVKESKRNRLVYFYHQLKYLRPGRFYHLDEKFKLEKKTGAWFDDKGRQLTYSYKHDIHEIEKATGFRYDYINEEWSRGDGSSLARIQCTHLLDRIKDKFGIPVTDENWNHWNGGVFLFDDDSHDFLEYWHTATLEIFKDKKWRTRDQGTLIATVWRFSLQDHFTLPIEFNFIADYNSQNIEYKGDLHFALRGVAGDICPKLIHIYHHWGDEKWAVWRDVSEYIQHSDSRK